MERALEQKWAPPERPAVRTSGVHRRQERPAVSAKKPLRGSFTYVPVTQDVFARNRLVAAIKTDKHREAYSVLQANVVGQMTENDWVSVGVTSPATGAGKTLTAINLSIALATQASREVLLLDLDLMHPSVHRYFEFEPKLGLEDCLFDGIALSEAAFKPTIDGLAVLPVRAVTHNATQILRSDSLLKLLGKVKKDDPERLIIVDLPPITSAVSARTYTSLVDGTLLIVEDTVTKQAHLRKALAMIGKSKLLGTVLNRTEVTA
jgi:capsular exopolysaccharide synthesis family protein